MCFTMASLRPVPLFTASVFVNAIEALKNSGDVLRRNALTGISHQGGDVFLGHIE